MTGTRLMFSVPLLLLFGPVTALAGNVLVIPGEYSHWLNMRVILEELVNRNHSVTVLVCSASPSIKYTEAEPFRFKVFDVPFNATEVHSISEQMIHFWMYEAANASILHLALKFMDVLGRMHTLQIQMCDAIFQDEELLNMLRQSKYELVLADPMMPCSDLLSEKLGTPLDMEEFVQSSGDDGIVVLSLGSMIKNLTTERGNIIASALGQIPQKVIWRYSGEKPENLAPNIRLYDWIPQNDLLGHPKTKAFITHGGTNGIYEAIYHGIPMVGIPLFADQPENMIHMKVKGAAVILDFNNFQSKDLVDGLDTVINDPSYKENAMRLSRIHHDQPMKPLDRAVFWIEFVMRNKGAKHLRVQAHNLTWYQYHSLDVFAALLATAALVTLIFFKTCRFCLRKCCLRSKTKSKND
ncbi:hypothetical protein AAFF_G00373100 [Aldrovandia affinis]|uniref:UDP-glucuronosyltransferase n=1 Tax=Aldrovandia affinis TaxID=143900 RepID=A0AAD7WMF1_9TELE|nr:hypothetical protein AAFF_G00373100 [Aldrovandia affinis]